MVTPFFIFLLYPSTIHPKDNHFSHLGKLISTILGRFKPLLGRNKGKKNKNMWEKGEYLDEREENKKYSIKMTTSLKTLEKSLKYLSEWFRFGTDLLPIVILIHN